MVFWLFPLFHVVRLDHRTVLDRDAAFDAEQVAATIWHERLIPSLPTAADAPAVLAMLRDNPRQAREQYARTLGIGRNDLYFLRGKGTIVSVASNGIGIAFDDQTDASDVVIKLGPLFGNTIRDATGLVKPSEFANSEQFNDVSAQLNRIVESRMLPLFKAEAKLGRKVNFVACAEVSNDRISASPLIVVPLELKFD